MDLREAQFGRKGLYQITFDLCEHGNEPSGILRTEFLRLLRVLENTSQNFVHNLFPNTLPRYATEYWVNIKQKVIKYSCSLCLTPVLFAGPRRNAHHTH